MKDKLCLIPYGDIILDKTYTNIGEYFLRAEETTLSFLRAFGSTFEGGSDFELLSEFLKVCKEKDLCDSALAVRFSITVKKLIDAADVFSMSAEEIWTRTSDALLLEDKNKLRAAIAASGLESVGVSMSADDEFDPHFVRCGKTDISPVFCPFGIESVSLDTIKDAKNLNQIEKKLAESISFCDSIALFFNGFSFEVPNEYSASKTCEKLALGQSLSYKESDILKAQLLRMTALAAAENQKDIMMLLPLAPDVSSMGAVNELLDYIDEIGSRIGITVYAGDAVSLCMARAIAGKKYKNIIAATGVSGNGNEVIQKDILSYWGAKEARIESFASLAKTAAGIISC